MGQMLKAAPRTEIFILMNAWAAGAFANFGVTFVSVSFLGLLEQKLSRNT